jgi:hypothetical protein
MSAGTAVRPVVHIDQGYGEDDFEVLKMWTSYTNASSYGETLQKDASKFNEEEGEARGTRRTKDTTQI